MRLKISLKGEDKLFIPFNYNHILSSIIYNKIIDKDLANELHSAHTFKFFTFSQLNIYNKNMVKNGFISRTGQINFKLTSPNDYLIKSLVEGHLDDLKVNFINQELFVEKIEILKDVEFKNKMNFKTISPIIVRIKKETDGKLKVWDLQPNEELFYRNLEKNLVKKYNQFYNTTPNEKENENKNKNKNETETEKRKEKKIGDIEINSQMRNVKSKRITIEKGNQKTFHRAYLMDINLKGDEDLIKFGYNCGLGEKNSLGFGMIQ
ncbi:MAG: CRISPR-associated endoribonuclease Cas6 [Methanobrevibacter sp.]|jgi:CRISPR-associated endoribonuclease Cas6|nr:CRISPR-associated endoribonuclease Cas6 [Candidatus Methanoflexus mossambicus]